MKYSLLDQIAMESEYNSMRLNHFMQCNIDNFAFEAADIYNDADSGVITEHDASILYENAFTDIIDKLVAFIQKIIDNIAKFFNELRIRIFGSQKEKDKLKKIKEAAKAAKNKGLNGNMITKKVKIFKIKRNRKALDAYIKEMSQLERRMLNLKYQAAQDSDKLDKHIGATNTTATTMIEYAEIQKKIDECNRKYDKIVNANAEVVELAMNDAIRFSDKDLDSIGLDLDAIKKGSDKVLARFKSDAKGVKSKQQANLIQKAVQSIETRVRKTMKDGGEYQTKNSTALFALFAGAGIIATGASLASKAGIEINPVKMVKGAVDKRIDAKTTGEFNNTVDAAVNASFGTIGEDQLNASNSKAIGSAALAVVFKTWVTSNFPAGATIGNGDAKKYLSLFVDTSKVTHPYQLPYCLDNFNSLVDVAFPDDQRDKLTQSIIQYMSRNPEKFKSNLLTLAKNKGSLSNADVKKFIDDYVKNVVGVDDISSYASEQKSYRIKKK